MNMQINEKRAKPISYGGVRDKFKYIVIHYTGNANDTARGNANYFATGNERTAGAHYFVDATEIWQSIPDMFAAWSVGGGKYGDCVKTGGGKYYNKCTNFNSISIELCCIPVSEKTIQNALELTEMLMQKYNIPKENVIRHFDVTGKRCPEYWCGTAEKNRLWLEKFWNKIGTGVEDMTREETEKICNDMIYKYNTKQTEEITENIMRTVEYLFSQNAEKRYNTIEEIPEWARDTIAELMSEDVLQGDGENLALSKDMIRVLVMIKRMLNK